MPIAQSSPLSGESYEDLDEVTLVAAIARHHHGALAEAHRRHAASVVAFVQRLTGSASLAEDVVQDVFVRLWESPGSFDPIRGALATYLVSIARGRAIDIMRSDRARRTREHRTQQGLVPNDPLSVAMTGHEMTLLRSLLDSLPDQERMPIELAYFGDLTYRQVAQLLGEPEGTTKSRIRSGLTRLRNQLGQ